WPHAEGVAGGMKVVYARGRGASTAMPERSGEFFVWRRPGCRRMMPSAHALPCQRPPSGMIGSIAAALRGTGCRVPDRVVTNDWFTNYVETSDEWIRTRTGIRERRFVGPGETAGTLAVAASRNALAAAGLTADDLD